MQNGSKNNTEDTSELGEQLKKIILEKRILKTIIAYYARLGNFNPASGVSLDEYKNYLHDQGYSELRNKFLDDIEKKVQHRMTELDIMSRRKAQTKKEMDREEDQKYLEARLKIYEDMSQIPESQHLEGSSEIQHLTQIMLIPSWRKLLDNESFIGFYLGQPVLEIIRDNVLFLPDFAVTGFEETKGEPFIFLSGVGVYYTQFRLSPGEIIT
ncbi:MAG: hypothetical protein ACXAB2_15375, partial [Candidatus Hodarchaeales archaeon]